MRRFGRITLASMLLDETMSQADLDDLGKFLDSDALPKDCMDLAALDGFLTALVVGPDDVPPSEWFPVIWGTQGERPIFRSQDEENRIRRLVMRFYHDVVRTFWVEDGEFVPLFNYWLGEGKPRASGEEWCSGFYLGLSLRSDDWQPLCEDEEHAKLLDPIFWFLDEEDRQAISAGRDPEAMREEMLRSIVPSVFAINTYWKNYVKAQREKTYREVLREIRLAPPRTETRRVALKPRFGPDAPCPCGSGKKLKECCRFVN